MRRGRKEGGWGGGRGLLSLPFAPAPAPTSDPLAYSDGPGSGRLVALSPSTAVRAHAPTAGMLAVMRDVGLGHDDGSEGQLGETLFFPDVVELSSFCRPRLRRASHCRLNVEGDRWGFGTDPDQGRP